MKEKNKKNTDPKKTAYDEMNPPASIQNWGDGLAGLTTLYSPQIETKDSNGICVRDVADTLVGMGRLTSDQLSEVRGAQLKNVYADTDRKSVV